MSYSTAMTAAQTQATEFYALRHLVLELAAEPLGADCNRFIESAREYRQAESEEREFELSVHTDLLPKLAGSALVITIWPETNFDVKYCVEIGAAVAMNKPIVVVVPAGRELPADHKLRIISDAVVEIIKNGDGNTND